MSRPIIPILFSYSSGLVAGYYLNIPIYILIALLFISASLTTAFLLLKRLPFFFFLLSTLTFLLLGAAKMEFILNPFFPENHITNLISDEPLSIEGTICEPVERGLDRARLYINLLNLYTGDEAFPVTGKLLLTIGEKETGFKYGDTIRFLAKVRKPRNFHNPGGFDYEKYLALRGISATAYLRDAGGIIKTAERVSSFSGRIERLREAIRESVFKYGGAAAPVLLALITGEQGEIPKDIREAFSRAGTAHILAISGEHIGMIIAVSFAFFLWLLKRSEWFMLTFNIYKTAAIMAIPAVFLYSLIAGSGFSIVRAAVMGGMVLFALLLDRRRDIPNLIAFAAFLILVFEPQALFDISFQLSFASVISLALITPYLKRIYAGDNSEAPRAAAKTGAGRILRWLAMLAAISIAAAIGTAPLVAYYFNRFSIISPITNLIIVPIVGLVVVPIGLLSSILIPVSPYFSGLLISLNSFLISTVVRATDLFAGLPISSIRVVTPTLLEISLFYLLIIFFIYRRGIKLAGLIIALLIGLLAAIESFYFFRPSFQKDLKVTFLDVGQGESTLIKFPGGKRMLIDGGGLSGADFDIGERIVAPFLWHERIRRIDYLVLSHPNFDHYGGLPFILRNFEVGEVWEGGIEGNGEGYGDFRKAVTETPAGYKKVEDGYNPVINNATVEVLNPPKGYLAEGDRVANNGSIVLKIGHGKTSFLFTGDMEEEAEKRLLSKGDILKSAVLKVPHHGSLTSSTVAFLNKVRPEKAVFSVGYKNRFGFPKEAVIKRYRGINADIYRTDRDGAVTAVSDGVTARFFRTLN